MLDENAKRTASLDEAVKTTAGAVDGLAKAGKAQKLLLTMLHLRSASQQPGPFVAYSRPRAPPSATTMPSSRRR